MFRLFLTFAGLFGALGVGLGAYASHGLTKILTPEQVAIFKIGVQYQLYHAITLIGVALLSYFWPNRLFHTAGVLFIIGVFFFAGTLYNITLFALPNMGTAPIGGMAFMLGWLLLCIGAWKIPAK